MRTHPGADRRPTADETERLIAIIGPVVDAHHHLWDLETNHYPWLQERPVPMHFGDYAAIRRSYLPEDLRADAAPVRLAASVHVEAHWRGGIDSAGETQWLAGEAARTGLPGAIMGAADLRAEDAEMVLDAHQRHAAFRGVRIMAKGRGAPEGADYYRDPAFLAGFGALAERGLIADLQAPTETHAAIADLADRFPQTPIVLTHCGLPFQRPSGWEATWHRGLTQLAARPSVRIKLSGIPMTDRDWTVASLSRIARPILDLFGPERVMFGSNFPVDRLASGYATLLGGYAAALGTADASILRAIFHDTALGLYRPVAAEMPVTCHD